LQYKTIEKDYNQISKNAAYREHSSEILTSRRLPFIENSTKLKDSLEISEQFCSPENMELSIDKLMEEFSIDEDEIAKQIEVPPKQNL
jgi:hypothetical protein